MDSSQKELISFGASLEIAPSPNGGFADKVARYKWNPLGPVGDFQWIDKRLIHVDKSYQRDAYKAKILEIASNWSWQACNAISVMKRPDGVFVAVDGQHRLVAACHRSDIIEIPCMVFESCGASAEADAFVELNTNRKPVTAFAKYRARLVAGSDVAKEITSIANEHGLSIRESSDSPNTITCIAAMERLYAKDPSSFKAVIAIAAKVAKQDGVNVPKTLLNGLAYLDGKIPGGLADKRLSERIMQVGAKALAESAMKMAYRTGSGGDRIWAEGMMEILNRGIRSKFKMAA